MGGGGLRATHGNLAAAVSGAARLLLRPFLALFHGCTGLTGNGARGRGGGRVSSSSSPSSQATTMTGDSPLAHARLRLFAFCVLLVVRDSVARKEGGASSTHARKALSVPPCKWRESWREKEKEAGGAGLLARALARFSLSVRRANERR